MCRCVDGQGPLSPGLCCLQFCGGCHGRRCGPAAWAGERATQAHTACARQGQPSSCCYWHQPATRLCPRLSLIEVLDKAGNKVWVQLVQHVTGYQHFTAPPLFGFSLPMSVLMYLADGPGGTKLIGRQVDYHSFDGILFCAPGLGYLMQHVLRRFLSAFIIGSAQLGAQAWPPLERWLQRTLPGGREQVEGLKALAARVWWRQVPPASWRAVPAPYNPHL